MDEKLVAQFDGLLEKYTELLLGESNDELKKRVQAWALYTHIAKSMPPLAKHWNETYPDAKEGMKQLIAEIKELNDAHRANKN
jgi:inorganic pyrophosphatase